MTSKQQDLTGQIAKPLDLSLDIAYVQQFFRLAYELTQYRFQIANALTELFGDPENEIAVPRTCNYRPPLLDG